MVTDTREVEMKYEAGLETVLPLLEDLPRVASEAGPDELKLEAEYYDTGDLRLLRAGVTLRRRRGGKDAGWHLKLPAGPQTRREIQAPLGRSGRTVPAELASLVRVYTRGEALAPDPHRRGREVARGSGRGRGFRTDPGRLHHHLQLA